MFMAVAALLSFYALSARISFRISSGKN